MAFQTIIEDSERQKDVTRWLEELDVFFKDLMERMADKRIAMVSASVKTESFKKILEIHDSYRGCIAKHRPSSEILCPLQAPIDAKISIRADYLKDFF